MKKFVLLFGVLGILSSCNNDDDFTDVVESEPIVEKVVKMEILNSVEDGIVKYVDIDIISSDTNLSISGADWDDIIVPNENTLLVSEYANENQYSVYETDQPVRQFSTSITIHNYNSESVETVVNYYADEELIRTETIVTDANDEKGVTHIAPINGWVDGF